MQYRNRALAAFLTIAIALPCMNITRVAADVENGRQDVYTTYAQIDNEISNNSDTYMSIFEKAGAPEFYENSEIPNGNLENIKWFDETIEGLLNASKPDEVVKTNLATFTNSEDYSLNADGYMVYFSGTMTAQQPGTYTFVGLQIDNACTIKVDGKVVYEYWSRGAWFDGSGHRLAGDTSFKLNANVPVKVEIYFLELGGGEKLDFAINDGTTDKTFAEAGISFDLSATTYRALSIPSEFNGHSYQLFDKSMTWQEARAYCEDLGGHLVTITTAEEQAFVETLLDTGYKYQYWIGLTTAEDPQWITGEAFSYSNWDYSMPDNHSRDDGESEDYVHISNMANPHLYGSERYKWNDMYYDNIFREQEDYFSTEYVGFICEWGTPIEETTEQSSEYSHLMGESWDNAGMKNIGEYLATFPSISKAILDSYNSNQEFINSVAAWKTMNLIFEPGQQINDTLSMKDYYSAILLSLIDSEIMDENYIKSVEESSQFEYAKLFGEFSELIKSCDEIDHEKLLSNGTCSIEEITILNNKINTLDGISSKMSSVSKFLSIGKSVNESVNLCVNYYNLCNTSKYIVNVLKKIKANSSDVFLSTAIDEIVNASESAFNSAASGVLAGAENAAKDCGADIIDKAWQSLLKNNVITKGALLGYKVGKPLSNGLFSTDAIISNYFEFTALYEIEKAIKITIKEFETDFYNKVDADSSLNYINTVSLYFKTYYLSCDYAIELAKYSNLCPFAYVFYNGKQSFEETNNRFSSLQSGLKDYEDQLFRLWTYSLKESYPEIYLEIAPSLSHVYSTDLSTALVRLEYLTQTYTGEELKPSVTVTMGNVILLPEEYTVTYYNNTEPGTATVKIAATEKSIYTGEKTVEFIIKELPFVKRLSIRRTALLSSMFSLCDVSGENQENSDTELPDIYFYEGDNVVASVENGVITNDELPIFITENGIDVLMQNKNYTVDINGDSLQLCNIETQQLNEELAPTKINNYNNLSMDTAIHCNIYADASDEVVVNNEVLKADFSTTDTTEKQQYNIYSDQCVVSSLAYEEQRVYISATIPEGNIFVGWTISPQVSLNGNSAVSSFIMPNDDVYVSAGFIVNQSYFELKNAINEASKIEDGKYTKASYEKLQETINECKYVLKNDISQELSQEKVVELQTAISLLEEIQPLNSIGDINSDGVVNAKDVANLRRYLAGGWDVTIDETEADVNGDDTINAKDVANLRRYLAGGWDVTLG